MTNTTRIAKNTLALYFRQILIMLVSLYTVRVVLNTLGAEDYGIYNVAAGVVSMFGFLSSSMAAASQRYLSFELGRGNVERVTKVFSLSFLIHVVIAAAVLLFAETAGLWFVRNKLVIPAGRESAALWVYEAAVLSFVCTILTAPYMAAVIAHENMSVYAYVSIVEAVLKLAVVFLLRIIAVDRLKLYGVLLCAVTFINTGIYRFVCVRKYKECRVTLCWDGSLFRELFSFAGWSLFGVCSGIIRNQGANIVLNMYFGAIANAAYSIAMQVNTAVVTFITNLSTAVRPQLVKQYSCGNKTGMASLFLFASKAAFFLMFLFFLPLQLELGFVLQLWLKELPEYAVVFTRVILVNAVFDAFCSLIFGMAAAAGKIKTFQITEFCLSIVNILICFVFVSTGFSAAAVPVIGVVVKMLIFILWLILMTRQLHVPVRGYITQVLLPVGAVGVLSGIAPYMFAAVCAPGIFRLFGTVCISVVSVGLAVFAVGLTRDERRFVVGEIRKRIPVLG